MANPISEIASTIQAASINRHPSPQHDLNPSTAASAKRPVSPTSSIASSEESIPLAALKPVPRKANLPPLPDLRFEQSYLKSLEPAKTWQDIAWITTRDHLILPLGQGVVWNLILAGWRHWNQGAKFYGAGLGSRVRRWWWGVNNWEIPEIKTEKTAERVGEFYMGQIGSGQGD